MPWGGYRHHPLGVNLATVDALVRSRFANAEEAKENGGMVALFPRTDDAMQMAVPGGEPLQDLHLTLAFLGDSVGGLNPDGLIRSVSQIADTYGSISAQVLGHASFNPDGGQDGDKDPCSVYLISDSSELDRLHGDVLDAAQSEVNLPVQHAPWIPHTTAGYGIPVGNLSFTGQVTFDRIGVAFMGTTQYFPLHGATS